VAKTPVDENFPKADALLSPKSQPSGPVTAKRSPPEYDCVPRPSCLSPSPTQKAGCERYGPGGKDSGKYRKFVKLSTCSFSGSLIRVPSRSMNKKSFSLARGINFRLFGVSFGCWPVSLAG
jgi:hypothetical protein